MFEILFASWVLDVEVAAVLENFCSRNLPGAIGFFPALPPGYAV